ncbi:hypothetical protein SynA1825c_02959 [Synechococcus sp. A18-25c]|nr:hypothetical protein SynA1825c_02959 [Synechococcus sp. A18-25c]
MLLCRLIVQSGTVQDRQFVSQQLADLYQRAIGDKSVD